MNRLTQENIVAGIVLLVLLTFLVVSFSYGERARLVPVPIAVIGIALTLVQLYWQNTRPEDDLHVDLLEMLKKDQVDTPDVPKPPASDRTVAVQLQGFAVVAALLLLFLSVGPFLATFIFVSTYLTTTGYKGIAVSAAIAAVLSLALWGLFISILGIQAYWGLLKPVALSLGL